jgi:hypothetical protein
MKRIIATAATILLASTPALAYPPQYLIDLLGPASIIADINPGSEAVGGDNDPITGAIRAFVAGPTHPHELLPLPSGYTRSRANGINDAGVIVGGVSTNLEFPNEHGDAAVCGNCWPVTWQTNISRQRDCSTKGAFVDRDGTSAGAFSVGIGWDRDVAVADDRALFVAVSRTVATATNDIDGRRF